MIGAAKFIARQVLTSFRLNGRGVYVKVLPWNIPLCHVVQRSRGRVTSFPPPPPWPTYLRHSAAAQCT